MLISAVFLLRYGFFPSWNGFFASFFPFSASSPHRSHLCFFNSTKLLSCDFVSKITLPAGIAQKPKIYRAFIAIDASITSEGILINCRQKENKHRDILSWHPWTTEMKMEKFAPNQWWTRNFERICVGCWLLSPFLFLLFVQNQHFNLLISTLFLWINRKKKKKNRWQFHYLSKEMNFKESFIEWVYKI